MGSDITPIPDPATPTGGADVRFRPVEPDDKARLLEIAAQIWEGHDYMPHVFDRWVEDRRHYFAAMTFGGRLVGCGRLAPFDARRGWLEGLRVDPGLQGRGLGRLLSRHMAMAGRERGFERLIFSTYFGNHASIRINEDLGFRRTAAFTHLELALEDLAEIPDLEETAREVEVTPGIPDTPEMMANDWTFLPGDLPDRGAYFPNAETVRQGENRIVVADNLKYGGRMLDICWFDAPSGLAGAACLRYAIAKARAEGRWGLHTMASPLLSLKPFLAAGFVNHEQPADVYLFEADAAELKL
jgi:GNAT superfamily N-acetyltransferase